MFSIARGGAVRRASLVIALGVSGLVSGLGAGSALASQYPTGSLFGTQSGVVPSDSTPGGQVQTLTDVKTGLVADDANASMSAGTQMIQWGANGGYNQDWVLVPSSGANAGYDEIQNRQSGLCLDVANASTAQDAPVIQWTCTGNANQQWQIQSTQDSGVYFINNKNSGGSLAVADGESGGSPGYGAGLVQDVDNTNSTDTWRLSLTTYELLTNLELGVAGNIVTDETNWACVSGYHFRMASPGTYNSAESKWTAAPQADVDQAAGNSSVQGNNLVSTKQGPDGGLELGWPSDPTSESWTNAFVETQPGSYPSDPNPAAASSGNGVVSISYFYSDPFQSQDLDEQVYLHCDPTG
jgi:hypothetical protein